MRLQIEISNKQAAINRNLYPIQEQATQMELWEYVPCNCDETCTCKKFGWTHHWKLKKDIRFEDFVTGFLRMFVDCHQHQNILDTLDGKDSTYLNSRAIGAFRVLHSLKKDWAIISAKAASHNKTLFCDDSIDSFFKNHWSFYISESIYKAKQFCLLLPDICIPYDTRSRKKLKTHFGLRDINYYQFLAILRREFIKSMEQNRISLSMMRSFDKPHKQLPFNSNLISLRRSGIKYGTEYVPDEREISIVIDKCFYQPKSCE